MNNFKALIQVIRWPNLLIVFITQLLAWLVIVKPVLVALMIGPTLSIYNIILLALSTVFIAAGGYLVNDIFDIEIDKINKADKMIIGKYIPIKKARQLYFLISGLGIILALVPALFLSKPLLILAQVLIVGALFLYSKSYKRMPLLGNVVVSFLSAFVILIIILYEPRLMEPFSKGAVNYQMEVLIFLAVYAVFAFLVSMLRELVKDLEDIEGDRINNCKTFPIIAGEKASKIVYLMIAVLLLALMGYASTRLVEYHNYNILIYSVVLLVLPLLYSIYLLFKSGNKQTYALCSKVLKFIMLAGVLSMVLLIN